MKGAQGNYEGTFDKNKTRNPSSKQTKTKTNLSILNCKGDFAQGTQSCLLKTTFKSNKHNTERIQVLWTRKRKINA